MTNSVTNTANTSANQQLQPASQFPTVPQFSGGGGKPRKGNVRKLTTADISMPTDFKHVVHVGWSSETGFDLVGNDPNSMNTLNTFLKKAGVSEQELSDRNTRAFIYNFIESNNVLKLADETVGDKAAGGSPATGAPIVPPPVPSRQTVTCWSINYY